MSEPELTVALAGNPNAGKTTVFNAVTGQRQHVGNYPGVTVEKKEGWYTHDGADYHVVDLPGTYSLTAFSLEERVARNFLIEQKPAVVVDVVDCSNLERNLYLAVQLMEMGAPLVLAFNKSDLAGARGYRIDVETLSKLLGVPIVATVGHKGKGVDALLDAAAAVAVDPVAAAEAQRPLHYGRELEPEIEGLAALAAAKCPAAGRDRWVAVKLLEDDAQTAERLRGMLSEADFGVLAAAAAASRRHIRQVCGDDAEIILADRRYGIISGACQEAVQTTVEARHQFSDRIDAVVTNRIIGLPLFLLLTLTVFQLTFWLGTPLADLLDAGKELLAGGVSGLWPKGSESIFRSLIVDAVIGGVGAVIVFVPMLIGFGCTVPAIMATRTLENRRDRLTTMLVLPLFSCSARLPIYVLLLGAFFPVWTVFSVFGVADVTNQALLMMLIYLIGIALAVTAARILRSTIFRGDVTPFVMELPPYRLPTLRGALIHTWDRTWMFLRKAGTIILLAVVILWAMSTFPRLPEGRRLQAERLQAGTDFIEAAGKVGESLGAPQTARDVAAWRRAVLMLERTHSHPAAEIDKLAPPAVREPTNPRADEILRALMTSAPSPHEDIAATQAALVAARDRMLRAWDDLDAQLAQRRLKYSIMGRVGWVIAPVMKPCGFDWKISTSLIGALAAKEIFVSQMGMVFAVGDVDESSESLRRQLQTSYSPLQGFSIMLFCLITAPCVATIVMLRRESGSWKWALLAVGYLTALAWLVSTAVYQVGSALGIGVDKLV